VLNKDLHSQSLDEVLLLSRDVWNSLQLMCEREGGSRVVVIRVIVREGGRGREGEMISECREERLSSTNTHTHTTSRTHSTHSNR
jgi:hypothetical protein